MNTDRIREFFDKRAETWDETSVRDGEKIREILDLAQVSPGDRVLDVATGTGVLLPDYLLRNVASVVAIDLSPEMIRVAKQKCGDPRVTFLIGDVLCSPVGGPFDVIMIYNAFPHFPDPSALLARLSSLLAPGGRLVVAHGASRAEIDAHHRGAASGVSLGLPEIGTLASLFPKTLTVTHMVSTDRLYVIVGERPL